MIPKNPGDININASQQGLLEIAEHFFRRKVAEEEMEADKNENNDNNLE